LDQMITNRKRINKTGDFSKIWKTIRSKAVRGTNFMFMYCNWVENEDVQSWSNPKFSGALPNEYIIEDAVFCADTEPRVTCGFAAHNLSGELVGFLALH
jgi:hypothetical protein